MVWSDRGGVANLANGVRHFVLRTTHSQASPARTYTDQRRVLFLRNRLDRLDRNDSVVIQLHMPIVFNSPASPHAPRSMSLLSASRTVAAVTVSPSAIVTSIRVPSDNVTRSGSRPKR